MKSGSMPYHLCIDVLGNPLRIAMIKELERGPKSVGELAENTGEEQSKVSHSLAALKKCGFAESEKQGKKTVYRLGESMLKKMQGKNLFEALEKHYKEHGCKCRRCD